MPKKLDLSGGTKVCSKCGQTKTLDKFRYHVRGKRNPYSSACIECSLQWAKDNRQRLKVPCPKCGKPISRKGATCRECYHKSEAGQKHHQKISAQQKAKKKLRYCVDCGVEIYRQSTRCMKCKSKGEHNSRWDGGKSSLKKRIISSFEYRQWRSDVFTRDNFTCSECGVRGVRLHAHHIMRFSEIVKNNNVQTLDDAINCNELWNINNGITMCVDCHNKLHKEKGYFYGEHS